MSTPTTTTSQQASYEWIVDTGTVEVDTTELLSDVEGEWTAAFGTSLNTDASTPQGVMIAAETTARAAVMKNNADVANTINPDLSYGVFLDAICALLGIPRGVNQSTIVNNVTMRGSAPTKVNAGSRAQTGAGDIFYLVNDVTFPPSGVTTGTFESQDYGSINVIQETWEIIDGTVGWGSVVIDQNALITPGALQLLDPQLKNARNQQLASQGTASAAAVRAAVLKVPNVTSCMVVENNTGAAGNVNGVTFTLPSALWVCVAGNNPSKSGVAAALYGAHNSGCPWDFGAAGDGVPVQSPNGVATVDPNTGLPYNVKWTTPILYDCYVNISIHQTSASSPDETQIQGAIMDYAYGLQDGENGLIVGASVSAYEVSAGAAREYPGMYVKACSVACVPSGSAAPAYPGGYVQEFVMQPFGQAIFQTGNITVNFV